MQIVSYTEINPDNCPSADVEQGGIGGIALTPFLVSELPALTDRELEQIEEQTSEALNALLSDHLLSENTRKSYASALRYWNAWHRATYGATLPLLDNPRRGIGPEIAVAFIVHHSPTRLQNGTIAMSMPEIVRSRMKEIGGFGQRRVADRKSRSAGKLDLDLPSVATVKQRIAALVTCHRIAGLPDDYKHDSRYRQALHALLASASKVAPAMLRDPKKHVELEALDAMLLRCSEDGLRGIRDAALLQASFFTGGRRQSELVSMQFSDLQPITLPDSVDGVSDGYVWHMSSMKGRLREKVDEAVKEVAILGRAADALDRWRDAVMEAGKDEHGPVWYRIVERKRDGQEVQCVTTPMRASDVWAVVKERANQIGLDPSRFGSHSLRSGAATAYLSNGGDLKSAANMLGHTKIETTMKYYDRRETNIAASVDLLRLTSKKR